MLNGCYYFNLFKVSMVYNKLMFFVAISYFNVWFCESNNICHFPEADIPDSLHTLDAVWGNKAKIYLPEMNLMLM